MFGEATEWKGDVAASKFQTRLASDPDIKGVYMESSFALAGTLQVLQAAQPAVPPSDPKHVFIVSNDGIPEELKDIKAGSIDATVSQPADLFAKYGLYYVKAAIDGKTFAPGKTDHGSTIIQVRDGLLEDQLAAPLVTLDGATIGGEQILEVRRHVPVGQLDQLAATQRREGTTGQMSEHTLAAPSDGPVSTDRPVVEAVDISKRYGSTIALDSVGIVVQPGTTHALVGRNGAGKSTLVAVLTGLQAPDRGRVLFGGRPAPALGDRDAWRREVACVYQKSTIIPTLTVAENLFLNRHSRRPGGVINWAATRREAGALLANWSVDGRRPDQPAAALTVEQRQLVEIARALSFGARFIILDEPTAQLDGAAISRLFDRIRALQAQGVTFLFISHHLQEIYEICDTVTVLRDARHILTATGRPGLQAAAGRRDDRRRRAPGRRQRPPAAARRHADRAAGGRPAGGRQPRAAVVQRPGRRSGRAGRWRRQRQDRRRRGGRRPASRPRRHGQRR